MYQISLDARGLHGTSLVQLGLALDAAKARILAGHSGGRIAGDAGQVVFEVREVDEQISQVDIMARTELVLTSEEDQIRAEVCRLTQGRRVPPSDVVREIVVTTLAFRWAVFADGVRHTYDRVMAMEEDPFKG